MAATTERSVADVLRAAKERISDPKSWCRGAFAKAEDRRHVAPTSDRACRWCAIGAMQAETAVLTQRVQAGRLLDQAMSDLVSRDFVLVTGVNDGIGQPTKLPRRESHRLVLRIYDRAIQLAEAASP